MTDLLEAQNDILAYIDATVSDRAKVYFSHQSLPKSDSRRRKKIFKRYTDQYLSNMRTAGRILDNINRKLEAS